MNIDRLIRAAPVQERFGPSLPQVIAPRLDRLPAVARRVGAVVALLVAVVVVALVLRSRDPVYSHSGPAAFSTTYSRSMTREPTPPGALLLVEQRDADGLIGSFEITPLHLPRYAGEISGLLPIVAINYERRLAAVTPAFQLQSEGRTRIINTPAFAFSYYFYRGATQYFGRVVFVTKDLFGDREGLILSMVQLPTDLDEVTAPAKPTPDAVGTGGVLFEPFERLRFS